MKKYSSAFINLLIPLLVLALTGCTSVAVDPTPRQQVVANAVEDVLAVGLVPVLAKNPAYLPEVRTARALLGSFTGTTLTPADVDSFLGKLKVAPEDGRAIAGVVNAAWDTYQRRYAEQLGKTMRPDVKLFITAVTNGIDRAIAATPK